MSARLLTPVNAPSRFPTIQLTIIAGTSMMSKTIALRMIVVTGVGNSIMLIPKSSVNIDFQKLRY